MLYWKYVEATEHLIGISQPKALVFPEKHQIINPRKLHLNTKDIDITIPSKM
jgi:hypothetical protein